MKITLLCSASDHPVNEMLIRWMDKHPNLNIDLVRKPAEAAGGDILFLISCTDIIEEDIRNQYSHVLVLHASDLPEGRGWSPHIWDIINGAEEICVSLLEAKDPVDSGDIWHQMRCPVPKTALYDEINQILFQAEEQLLDYACQHYKTICPKSQQDLGEPSYYPRRSPEDSRIQTDKSIEEQFDLIRVCDSNRFPAFFELNGQKYKITLEKI